jgi:hypothetical protein
MIRYLPAGPFLAALGVDPTSPPTLAGLEARCAPLGLSARTVYRWRHTGVPLDSADRAAFAVGHHPAILWGRTYLDAVLDQAWWSELRHELDRWRYNRRRRARARVARQPRDRHGRFTRQEPT